MCVDGVYDIALVILRALVIISSFFFFFFNDTATTEIYTLSLHDALPIWFLRRAARRTPRRRTSSAPRAPGGPRCAPRPDRKSTRLNSSHSQISYAVFCLKKKKIHPNGHTSIHQRTTAYAHAPLHLTLDRP